MYSVKLHSKTYADGQDNGSDGADQRPPAAKEEDAEGGNDSKDQCASAIVTAVGPVVGGHYRLGLAHHHHIRSVSLWV